MDDGVAWVSRSEVRCPQPEQFNRSIRVHAQITRGQNDAGVPGDNDHLPITALERLLKRNELPLHFSILISVIVIINCFQVENKQNKFALNHTY